VPVSLSLSARAADQRNVLTIVIFRRAQSQRLLVLFISSEQPYEMEMLTNDQQFIP
jgi:hypothetical protein